MTLSISDTIEAKPSGAAACCQAPQADAKHSAGQPAGIAPGHEEVILSIGGMRCGSCADSVRQALAQVDGVMAAHVIFANTAARIRFDAQRTNVQTLAAAVTAAGYPAELPNGPDNATGALEQTQTPPRLPWHAILIGTAASVGIVAFYLGLITLTSDWYNAKAQLSDYRVWILALAVGLGFQVGLFVHLRRFIAGAGIKGAKSSVAASGGMSTVSMALCCSHYVSAFLPTIGLPFLSGAAAGLAAYQVQFFALGVVSNLLGIAYMLRLMTKHHILTMTWRSRFFSKA